MNAMLTDDDLTRLLGEAAASFEVPDEGPGSVIEELEDTAPARPWLRRRGVQLTAAAAVVAIAAVLAQSLGGPSASPKQVTTAAGHGGQQSPIAQGFAGGATGGSASGSSGDLRAVTSAPGAAPVPAPAAVPLSAPSLSSEKSRADAAQQAAATVADGGDARVVKTGTITLMADRGKVSAVVTAIQRLVVAPAYVSSQSSQPIGDNPSATLTMRVPVGRFESVVTAVQDLGAKVVSVESSGKDVTAAYADTAAQIASLKAARSRFLTILAGAKTIGETLTVQQRVDDVQGQIDRLEGQRRVLENQSDLATLTVTVSEKVGTILKTTAPTGLSKAWKDAKHGFTSGVEALIARSGRALLVLIVAVLALVVARFGWRLARRRLL